MENDAYDLGLEVAFDASDPPATEQPMFEPLLEAAWWRYSSRDAPLHHFDGLNNLL